MSYLHNGSTLEHNSNWFGKLQWRVTTFVFPFLEIGHVTNSHGMDPDTQNHHDIVFLNFLVIHSFWFSAYNILVTIFGNVHRPYRHYFIATTVFIMSIFFPHFLALFTSVTILGNVHRQCKQCINTIKRVYIMSILFLLIFPDLVMIFAWITILEDVHRPCKQYTNIVENGLCHATPFFSDLFLMFWAYLHQLPY